MCWIDGWNVSMDRWMGRWMEDSTYEWMVGRMDVLIN